MAASAEKLQKDRKMKVERQNPINEYRQPFVVLRRPAPASTVPQMVLGTEILKAKRASGNRTRMLRSVIRNTAANLTHHVQQDVRCTGRGGGPYG